MLFDRDGTIVIDEPYNGDPQKVRPVPGARDAIDRIRARGLPVGVITNQSGVGRGMISMEHVDAVNRRIDELLGPFDGWFICPHAPEDACECRKPKPKLLLDAARAFGVEPESIVVVGDRDADMDVAANAGASAIRVGALASLNDAADAILARLA
ncbi:MAG: D-glycero-alpha-D-manno-heptose-1,7-bisphosphate 7-phosphatase [Vulcanimicrobiaceae bacterium]